MLVVELNEKIKVIKIQKNFKEFKNKIIEEYGLSKEQESKIFFTYIDEDDDSIYINSEEDYLHVINLAEKIVLNVEFKEIEKDEKKPSIDSLLSKGNIDAIIEKANKRIIDLKNEEKIITNKLENKINTQIIHNEIKCCECKNNIKGIIYQCCICNNCYFCEECEKKFGLIHNHPLLKIRNPELCPLNIHCVLK